MARDMKDAADLDLDYATNNLPATASRSREVPAGFSHDNKAQTEAAAKLAYSMHGNVCRQCGNATDESQLCRIGQQLYSRLRELGIV